MPFNGSGVFVRLYSWVAEKNAGVNIIASQMDDDTDDITTNGLGDCLTRDGQGSASADLPMNGFRHTNVGASNAANQYGTVSQIQGNSYLFATGGGTGDAITATFAPPITPANGTQVYVTAPAANTITTPTFNAATITKNGGSALSVGEYGTNYSLTLRYRSAGPSWELVTVSGLPSIADQRVLGNSSGGAAIASAITATQVLDFISTTSGKLLRRGGSVWAAVDPPILSSQVFTSSGTFTTPANTVATTIFKFSVAGGGGGGAGVSNSSTNTGDGGGAGGCGFSAFSGFSALQAVTVTIGASGTAGASGANAGGNGGTSKITASAVDVVTCTGGTGGQNTTNAGPTQTGTAGSFSTTVGASGLTLIASSALLSEAAGPTFNLGSGNAAFSGRGGSTTFGTGGASVVAVIGGSHPGVSGGGGSGAVGNATASAGGAGGTGFVLVEWVL